MYNACKFAHQRKTNFSEENFKSCHLSSGNGQVFIYILLQGKRGRKKSMSESGSAKKKYKKRGRKHSPEKKTKVGVQRNFF